MVIIQELEARNQPEKTRMSQPADNYSENIGKKKRSQPKI